MKVRKFSQLMKNKIALFSPLIVCAALQAAEKSIPNRLIDYPGYLQIA